MLKKILMFAIIFIITIQFSFLACANSDFTVEDIERIYGVRYSEVPDSYKNSDNPLDVLPMASFTGCHDFEITECFGPPSSAIGSKVEYLITIELDYSKCGSTFLSAGCKAKLYDITINKQIAFKDSLWCSKEIPTKTFTLSRVLDSATFSPGIHYLKLTIYHEYKPSDIYHEFDTKTIVLTISDSGSGGGGGDDENGGSDSNSPPNTPSRPVGPTTVTVGNEHPYYVTTTDPEREKVSYQFMIDYGVSEWSKFYDSGYLAALSVNFPYSGTYQISARAKDESGGISEWSTKLYVTAEKKEEYIYPPQVQISVTPGSIIAGEFASVTWSSTNANSVSITPNINPSNAQIGSVLVNPGSTTTYTAVAIGGNGITATASCVLNVIDPEPTVTLRADKTRVKAGDLVKIYWSSEYCNSVTITQGIDTNGAISGMETANPQRTTTYLATGVGNSGTATASLTIYITDDIGGIIESDGNPWLFVLVGILIFFILYNLIYFQRNKKWPPYKKYFKKIFCWIKNEEFVDEDDESPNKKKTKDKSFYDYVVEYGEPDFDEAAYLYRRKRKKANKKKKGGEK
jgi:hypothetical protein